MDFFEIITVALKALRTNKLRSFLTMLGIIIGVFSVILLVSIGTGLQYLINNQFENLGSNIVIIMPGKVLSDNGNFSSQGPPNFAGSKLSLIHVNGLNRLGSPIAEATGRTETPMLAANRGKTNFTTVIGVGGNYGKIRNTNAGTGRFITSSDVSSAKKVAVIGPSLADKLFPNQDPLNKEIKLSETRFRIVGVAEKKSGGFGVDVDNTVYLPITSAQKLSNLTNLQIIDVKIDSKDHIDEGIKVIKNYMKRELKDDEFSVLDQKQLLNTIDTILGAITAALGAIAAISLLVGGIGIMNIMLVSVTERTHEIGLRKAIGARTSDIAIQFLIEAVFLSVIGGIIGILAAFGVSLIISKFFQTVITLWSVFLAFGISSLIGIVFGVAPALRAARLNPIDALRYE